MPLTSGLPWFVARACSALLVVLALSGAAHARNEGSVPFVVSPEEAVHRMLRIAEVGPGDMLIDLGSGDGRIVIAAEQRGARALGVDIDPELVTQACVNAEHAGVAARARFEHRDPFDIDLS